MFAAVVCFAVLAGLLYRLAVQQASFVPAAVPPVRAADSIAIRPDARGLQRFDQWFARHVFLSRIPLKPSTTAVAIVALAGVLAMAVFVFTEQAGPAIMIGCLTIVASILGMVIAYKRMVSQFETQLPTALDLMARAVNAGESLDQAIGLVANSMEEPAKSEFVRCQNQLEMGLSMRAAMATLVDRIDTTSVRMMASILSVHRDSGGNLSETLQRLADVLRKRFDYERKLRAVTGAGRASVIVVSGLAWCIFGYLFLFRPEYGRSLWENPSGKPMLTLAFVLELTGMIWGWSLLRKRL